MKQLILRIIISPESSTTTDITSQPSYTTLTYLSGCSVMMPALEKWVITGMTSSNLSRKPSNSLSLIEFIINTGLRHGYGWSGFSRITFA